MLDMEFLTTVAYHLRYELLFSVLFGLLLLVSPDAWAKVAGEKKPKAPKQEKEAPKDPATLAAHITELSATRYGRAFDIYLANEPRLRGLGPELQQVVQALGVASVRVGRVDRLPHLFKGLQGRTEDAASVLVHCLRVLSSKQQYTQTIETLAEWRATVTKDLAAVPCLALSCAVQASVELRKVDEAEAFFRALTGRKEATARDYSAMIRLFAAQALPDQAKAVLQEMQQQGLQPDNVAYNMVLAVCSDSHEGADVSSVLAQMTDKDVVTYNTRLKACAKAKDAQKAFALFDELQQAGLQPTQVTFGSLLEVCTRTGDLQKARAVLKMMDEAKVPRNAVVYTSMLRGLAQQGQLKEAREVFAEMKACVQPDIICYSVLIKAHCDQGQLDPAIQLLEDLLEQGHAPDEILFNSLLAGCAQQPHVQLGEKLLKDMVSHHIKPTMATFSIMLKMYSRANAFQQSAQLLEAMPEKYGVVPAVRLYVQHVSWCIRLRRGSSALQVYKLLLARCRDCQDMDQFLTACASFNMLDTAVQLLEVQPVKFSKAASEELLQVIQRKKPQLAARAKAACK